MKIKFRLKGMVLQVKELPNGLSITIEAITKHSPAQCATIPTALEQRIKACKSMRELLELLFTTTEKTEAVMALFDQKINALEREGFSIHQTIKTNNNGSTSSAQFA